MPLEAPVMTASDLANVLCPYAQHIQAAELASAAMTATDSPEAASNMPRFFTTVSPLEYASIPDADSLQDSMRVHPFNYNGGIAVARAFPPRARAFGEFVQAGYYRWGGWRKIRMGIAVACVPSARRP